MVDKFYDAINAAITANLISMIRGFVQLARCDNILCGVGDAQKI